MEKRVQDYTQDILAVVRSNTSPAAMSNKLEDFHANDLADAMPRLTVQERCKLYRILDLNMLSDIFEYTDSDNAAEYVKEMDVKKGASILSRMETDALVEVLHKIDKAKKCQFLCFSVPFAGRSIHCRKVDIITYSMPLPRSIILKAWKSTLCLIRAWMKP